MAPNKLVESASASFSEWPPTGIPRDVAGAYTIWRGVDLLYAGSSWLTELGPDAATASSLWSALSSHTLGHRRSDLLGRFVYDRFVRFVSPKQISSRLAEDCDDPDRLTRAFIRQHLQYRYVVAASHTQARQWEYEIRSGNSKTALRPVVNPLPAANRCSSCGFGASLPLVGHLGCMPWSIDFDYEYLTAQHFDTASCAGCLLPLGDKAVRLHLCIPCWSRFDDDSRKPTEGVHISKGRSGDGCPSCGAPVNVNGRCRCS